ncbi:MAG: tetratricopeptide repeat protein, partial [Acidobacteriota bacterium]|nr:tetratricopeptide repeat protein [Acidobacteriota bacterium]
MRLLKEIQQLTGNYQVKSGMYHYARREFRQAEEFFRKALKKEEEDEETLSDEDLASARHYLTLALVGRAERLESREEIEEAIAQLERATEICDDFPDLQFRIGQLNEKLNRFDAAVRAYRAAIKISDSYLQAHVGLSFCLLDAGRLPDAEKAFSRALEIRQARTTEPFNVGLKALKKKDVAVARDQFHRVFRSAPELCEAYRVTAMEWLQSEDYEKALIDFDCALELGPRYPDL